MKKAVVLLASVLSMATSAYAEEEAVAGKPAAVAAEQKSAGDDYVLMRIGADEVKRSEIEKVWKSIFQGGNSPDFDTLDSGVKNNLLRGVATEHMLLKEAKKSPLVDSPELKERVRVMENQLLIQEFLKEKTKDAVSEDKIKALYDLQIKNRGEAKEELHVRHILLKTEEDAKAVVKKLKKGGDFSALVKEKSEDKSNAAQGGDLGWITADGMTPEFTKAAFALKDGQTSEPVKTDFGWHVIKAEGRRKAPPPSLAQMHDGLKNQLARKAVLDFVASITKGQKISVFDSKGMEKPLPAEPEAVPAAASPAEGH